MHVSDLPPFLPSPKPSSLPSYTTSERLTHWHIHPTYRLVAITMGFFNRRTTPADPNTTVSTGTTREKHSRRTVMSSNDRRHKRTRSDAAYGENSLNKRPKFGQWAKQTWPDVLTMIVMGVIGLGVCSTDFQSRICRGNADSAI